MQLAPHPKVAPVGAPGRAHHLVGRVFHQGKGVRYASHRPQLVVNAVRAAAGSEIGGVEPPLTSSPIASSTFVLRSVHAATTSPASRYSRHAFILNMATDPLERL